MPHHVVVPEAFADAILARRWLILALIAASVVACGLRIATTPVQTSITQGLMPDDSEFEEYRRRAARFGGTADDVIMVGTDEGDSLLTARRLDSIRAAARAITEMPEVRRVDTFVDAPWLAPNRVESLLERTARINLREVLREGGQPSVSFLSLPPYWPEEAGAQERVEAAALREALLELDRVAGTLVSRDARAQAFLVHLADGAPKQGAAPARLSKRLRETVRRHGLGEDDVHAAGVLVTEGGMLREVYRAIWQLAPLGAVLICALVYAIFRRPILVAAMLVIALTAVAWSVGATALAFGRITLLIAAAPLLVLVISTLDTIHLASAFLAELAKGASPNAAVRRTVVDVGGACVLTSVSTFVGFLSLMFVPAVAVRHFSLAASIGVAGALLLALVICPIAFSTADWRRPGRLPWGWKYIGTVIEQIVTLCRRGSWGTRVMSSPSTDWCSWAPSAFCSV